MTIKPEISHSVENQALSKVLGITRFRGYQQPHGERENLTVEQLFNRLSKPEEAWQKAAMTGWAPTFFSGDYRSLSNVIETYVLVFDYEKRKPLKPNDYEKLKPDDRAKEDLYQKNATPTSTTDAATYWKSRNVLGALATSYSHRPDHPRHRVVLILSRAVTATEYDKIWEMEIARLTRDGGHLLDTSTCDSSRFWFDSCYSPGREDEFEFHQWPGIPLDVDTHLAEWATSRPMPPPPLSLHPSDTTTNPPKREDISSNEKKRRAKAYIANRPPAIENAGGDNQLFKVVCDLFRFDLDADSALELLREYNIRCLPPWPDDKLLRTIERADKEIGEDRGSKLRETPTRQRTNHPTDPPPNNQATENPPQTPTGDPTVDRFNKEFFIGWSGADQNALNYFRIVNGDAVVVSKDSISDATASYPKLIITNEISGKPKTITAFNYWHEHSKRKFYEKVSFAPMKKVGPNEYNLFQGYAVKPQPDRSWCLLYEHWYNNICDKDQALFEYTFAWVANMFQRPYDKPGTAIVLFSKAERTGKGTLVHTLGRLLGARYYIPDADSEALFGRFNANQECSLLINPDEALWSGDKKTRGKIKNAITEPTRQIEHKGGKRYAAPNYSRYMITSNNEDAVHVDPQDGRFVIIKINERHANDHAYFGKIRAQLANGGDEALMHELMTFDLDASNINLRAIPRTTARTLMQRESWSPEVKFWFAILDSGLLPDRTTASGDLNFDTPNQAIGGKAFHDVYLKDARTYRGVEVLAANAFYQRLRELCPGIGLSKSVRSQELSSNYEGGNPVAVHSLPSLAVARASFESKMGQMDWSKPISSDDPTPT